MKGDASGDLTPKISKIGFEKLSDGVDRLARSEVRGRLVAMVEE